MMNTKNILISLIAFIAFIPATIAQEYITPLHYNEVLIHSEKPKSNPQAKLSLSLPFIDDFSDGNFYPKPQLWMDANVYINDDYPFKQPSVGVATFDALTDTGWVYGTASTFPFTADTLTSQIIDLSTAVPADSIFMSFTYQPGGLGNSPERDDSLVLEFYSKSLQSWVNVWGDEGRKLTDFRAEYGDWFNYVLIKVDTLFFSDEFRMRFYNYASITAQALPDWGGNVDQWHLDYVYVDMNRSVHDTMINNDLAFRDHPKSLLAKYQSMPWDQYKANPNGEMQYNVRIPYSGYYTNVTNPINQFYHVNSLDGGTSYTPTPYNFGNLVMPMDTVVIAKPSTGFNSFTFVSPSAPYAEFEIRAGISPFSTDEMVHTNDTVSFIQKFYNYYAYDDGTAEAGYGLGASNPNTKLQLAYRFDINLDDTLRSVQMLFNQVKNQANQVNFKLTIWEDLNGEPGDTLYQQDGLKPQFVNGINQFYTYVLTKPIPVSGTFYVGWEQNSGTNLNLGYDMNSDASSAIYYNLGLGWLNSQYEGALMIRPILGDTDQAIISVPDVLPVEESKELTIYPNPASSSFSIANEDGENYFNNLTVFIFDLQGRQVYEGRYESSINTSDLKDGIYIVRAIDEDSKIRINAQKLVIRH